jgi:hypothetical protein
MTTQDRFDMTSDLYKKPDGPVAPAVQEQLEKGNKLLVGCIRCMESTVVATSEELEVWFDVESDHIACPDCGPKYGVAVIVASVDDREVALKGFDAWMATLARLAGIERAET